MDVEMNWENIGKQIRKKRLSRSWDQKKLAERTGLSPKYIGMIERGEKVPKLKTFINIANALGVSSDELLSDVLDHGFTVRMSEYFNRMEKLNQRDVNTIYELIEVILKNPSKN